MRAAPHTKEMLGHIAKAGYALAQLYSLLLWSILCGNTELIGRLQGDLFPRIDQVYLETPSLRMGGMVRCVLCSPSLIALALCPAIAAIITVVVFYQKRPPAQPEDHQEAGGELTPRRRPNRTDTKRSAYTTTGVYTPPE